MTLRAPPSAGGRAGRQADWGGFMSVLPADGCRAQSGY